MVSVQRNHGFLLPPRPDRCFLMAARLQPNKLVKVTSFVQLHQSPSLGRFLTLVSASATMMVSSQMCKSFFIMAMVTGCYGARILGIIPMPAKSHNIVFQSLMRELASRQHQVTVLGFYPLEKTQANYTDIALSIDFFKNKGQWDMFAMNDMNAFQKIILLWEIGNNIGDQILQQPKVQELIHSKDQHFDLVILEAFVNEAFIGFAEKFKAPVIFLCPFGGTHWMGSLVGNPSPFSYIPDTFLNFPSKMTFPQRIYNTIVGTFGILGYTFYYIPRQDALMRKYFNVSDPLPNLSELLSKTALFIANTHVSLSYPKPLVPNFIQAGGMHIKPPKKLPQDLQKYLDEAPHGVIYFSMGSALQGSKMSDDKRKVFTEVFSRLKYKILWKWENDTLPEQPSNVKISKWFPQTDILAHPNIKLFMTHGGLLSTQEAVYHGVPLLGIPVFGDQQMNMVKVELSGFGIMIDFSNVTEKSLEWALQEILQQPRYQENAKRLSVIYRDQPQTPMETAVYWTEYVLRHKGASHLHSPALDLTWYQYFLLDVIAVLLIPPICILLLCFKLIKMIYVVCRAKAHRKQVVKGKSKKKTH